MLAGDATPFPLVRFRPGRFEDRSVAFEDWTPVLEFVSISDGDY